MFKKVIIPLLAGHITSMILIQLALLSLNLFGSVEISLLALSTYLMLPLEGIILGLCKVLEMMQYGTKCLMVIRV